MSFSRHAPGPPAVRPIFAWVLVLLLAGGVPAASPGQSSKDAKKTEAQLNAIKVEIDRVAGQVSRDQVERDRLARELRTAELSVSEVRGSLDRVRKERSDRAGKRSELAEERRQRQSDLARERESLAGQLRAAYLIGSEEPLKLLLNQKDPARAGRMFAYYSYFGRARAEQINRISTNLSRIEQLDGELAAEDQQLAALETQRRSELERLDTARNRRGQVLASLQSESRSREQSLERMKRQQAGLEKLLRELKRAMDRFPADTNTAFARLRGKLAWPVGGKLVARFGESRAGGVKWDGVLVATERGAPVRAIYQGRVVYADWLPGLGLLTIIDHGDGYLSLYGHNDRLYKAAGERVSSGEAVAAAGDSGGRDRPELYFEIRRAGKPVDPRPWFKGEP
ncbi:MAG: peptidoglycan DD-metalloendopeptidase family protein [Gammaproteobacteria bacterium]